MADDKPIVLTVTLKEVNGILVSLSRMPYIEVADLIAKLQTQAKDQVAEEPK